MTQRQFHITSNTLTPVTTGNDCYLQQIVATCTNAGTSWVIQIQDYSSPPKIVAQGDTKSADVGIPFILTFKHFPLYMKGGIAIFGPSGTAGVIDVWIDYTNTPGAN